MSEIKDALKDAFKQAVQQKAAEEIIKKVKKEAPELSSVVEVAAAPYTAPADAPISVKEYAVLSVRAQIARVLVRYAAMGLITAGVFTAGFGDVFVNDPEIVGLVSTGLGLVVSAVTELKFIKALKEG